MKIVFLTSVFSPSGLAVDGDVVYLCSVEGSVTTVCYFESFCDILGCGGGFFHDQSYFFKMSEVAKVGRNDTFY
jgi:hypothetical protein